MWTFRVCTLLATSKQAAPKCQLQSPCCASHPVLNLHLKLVLSTTFTQHYPDPCFKFSGGFSSFYLWALEVPWLTTSILFDANVSPACCIYNVMWWFPDGRWSVLLGFFLLFFCAQEVPSSCKWKVTITYIFSNIFIISLSYLTLESIQHLFWYKSGSQAPDWFFRPMN